MMAGNKMTLAVFALFVSLLDNAGSNEKRAASSVTKTIDGPDQPMQIRSASM